MAIEPGIIHPLSIEAYHLDPAISKSNLLDFHEADTPKHYITPSDKKTKASEMGQVIHAAVLEPDTYDARVETIPADVLNMAGGKSGKNWEEWSTFHASKYLITPEQKMDLDYILEEIEKPYNDPASDLLHGGVSEASFFFQHEKTCGYTAKVRPDHLPGGRVISDLKSTAASAEMFEFGKIAARKKYHWSAALTNLGVSIATGENHIDYVFVVVEQKPPYGVMVYQVDLMDIVLAWEQMDLIIPRLVECLKTNTWPCYPAGIHFLALPAWERKQLLQGGVIYDD